MKNKQSNQLILKTLKEIMLTRRKTLFHRPIGEDTVVLLTGGIDSSVLTDMYMEWSKTRMLYPLYIKRSAKAEPFELKAAQKITNYLSKKYKNRVAKLMEINVEIPPKKFKEKMNRKKIIFGGYKVRNTVLANYAVMYGLTLNDLGADVHTIIIGKVASDFFTGSREEDVRMMAVQACLNTEDWRWQVISPAFEPLFTKAFGFDKNLTKENLLSIGLSKEFPFEITRSCTNKYKKACGICEECKERLEVFKSLRSKDKIAYLT